ncbi:hypothetical protein SEA_CHEWYVIII_12 [Rhodococcus phage ChewyVIII]|uniref:Uncharacterized protein n=1 Tax=Rhodococcus phage ChewyVIII TaxID=1887657 RepID=A0A1C9EI60_9CAUD|nr:hypothetical protein QEH30_gp12 [Rhodococcus phage ChewyVIII]AON97435.1 hypothetical protein SEA_CHEWYVIII_12 [Rhodococcus phage ChewyVIII]
MAEWRVFYDGVQIDDRLIADNIFEAMEIIDANLTFERIEI